MGFQLGYTILEKQQGQPEWLNSAHVCLVSEQSIFKMTSPGCTFIIFAFFVLMAFMKITELMMYVKYEKDVASRPRPTNMRGG